jgi:hypothetical protein
VSVSSNLPGFISVLALFVEPSKRFYGESLPTSGIKSKSGALFAHFIAAHDSPAGFSAGASLNLQRLLVCYQVFSISF